MIRYGWEIAQELAGLIWRDWQDLLRADIERLNFANLSWALILGAGILVFFLGKAAWLMWRPKQYIRAHSGYALGAWRRRWRDWLWYNWPKIIVAEAVFFLLVAIAEPFFMVPYETKRYDKFRTRLDLVDVSGSMAELFMGSDKSKAEIARAAHLQFLKMRQGQNDRTSFWIFSSHPYQVEDFVIDDELYAFQVFDAPYVLVGSEPTGTELVRQKTMKISGEGGTDLAVALRVVLSYFDLDAKDNEIDTANQSRALLIVTDAEADAYPEEELIALKNRNVIPYLLFVNPRYDASYVYGNNQVASQLVENIAGFGGRYFDVRNSDSLRQAYEEINRLEKVKVEIRWRRTQVPFFQKILSGAMAILLLSVAMGLITEAGWGTYP